jgi:hypothetical protein
MTYGFTGGTPAIATPQWNLPMDSRMAGRIPARLCRSGAADMEPTGDLSADCGASAMRASRRSDRNGAGR